MHNGLSYISNNTSETSVSKLIPETAELLVDIRALLLDEKKRLARLQLLDISLKLEEIIFKKAPEWKLDNVQDMLTKICYLGMATAGSSYIEMNEWHQLSLKAPFDEEASLKLEDLTLILENAHSLVEWSASMVKASCQDIVDDYTSFEPKAYEFIDDKIRGSIALYVGESVGKLGDFIATESSLTNEAYMDCRNAIV